MNMFSTNFTYITVWNCGREAALPYSLCKMGAPHANRWTQEAAHDISLNVPSAEQQQRGEIPGSHWDLWKDLDFLQQHWNEKQSMVWKHSGSPKLRKFKQTFHGRKLMTAIFGRETVFCWWHLWIQVQQSHRCETLKQLKQKCVDT